MMHSEKFRNWKKTASNEEDIHAKETRKKYHFSVKETNYLFMLVIMFNYSIKQCNNWYSVIDSGSPIWYMQINILNSTLPHGANLRGVIDFRVPADVSQ